MIHEKDSEAGGPEDSEMASGFLAAPASTAAYIVGACVIIGAILISASLFYNFKLVLGQMDKLSSLSAAAPAAPSAPAQGSPSAPAAPAGPVNITLAPNTPFLGSASAKVTVVEYADYQCPFCEQFYKNTWPDLKTKYVDTGKIKFVYQDFAFLGPDSITASEAAHCAADQNKFWQYHDYLFANQGQEGSAWATADHQKQFAKTVGLNTSAFNQCLDSHKYTTEVNNETAAGKSYGVTGTPTVFVNGSIIVGAQPAVSFESAIDAALKK